MNPTARILAQSQPLVLSLSLSNQTRQLGVRLDGVYGARGGAHGASYGEYEILQHQKEELELQNRRLVERISKLKYILKGGVGGLT